MTKEGSTKIVTFMTPRAGVLVLGLGNISHIVKMHFFFKNLLLYSQALIRQTKYVVFSCARAWPYKSYSETALFLEQSSSLLPGIDQTN